MLYGEALNMCLFKIKKHFQVVFKKHSNIFHKYFNKLLLKALLAKALTPYSSISKRAPNLLLNNIIFFYHTIWGKKAVS